MPNGPLGAAEQGLAVIEFAVCLPLLVTLLLGIADASLAAHDYLKLSWVSYEGARYGSSLPALEEGLVSADGPSELADFAFQAQVRRRVWSMLNAQTFISSDPIVHTRLIKNGDSATGEHTFMVAIHANYKGLFTSFPLKVSTSGPYLMSQGS